MKYNLVASMLLIVKMISITQIGAARYTPPTSGKFFYAQLNTDDQYRSYVTFGVGGNNTSNQTVNLMLNSDELSVSLFTTDCSSSNTTLGALCTVPDPYKPVNISTDDQRVDKNTSFEIAYLYQNSGDSATFDGGISRINLTGWQSQTTFNITLPTFLREFVYNGYVFEIMQLSVPYKSDLISGFVGLGPYTAIDGQDPSKSRVSYGENFMYQLKHEGHIDSQVVAFYIADTDYGSQELSMVKFGSYDPECFASSMRVLDTINTNSWAVNIYYIQINMTAFDQHPWYTIVEPAYPFIYLPQQLFEVLNSTFRQMEPFELTEKTELGNLLKGSCGHVKQLLETTKPNKYYERFGFGFYYQKYRTFFVWFDYAELLFDASYVFPDMQMNEACFIGIFPNTNAKDTNAIYLGQSYLKKYYTFFDASGYQSGKHDSLVVGTGPKNPNAQILKETYNSSTWNFDRNEGDQSQWTYTPNPLTNKIHSIDDGSLPREENNKTILYILIIATAFMVVITVVVCTLYRKKKRTERAARGNITSTGKTNDGDELSVPLHSGRKQDINASQETGQTLA